MSKGILIVLVLILSIRFQSNCQVLSFKVVSTSKHNITVCIMNTSDKSVQVILSNVKTIDKGAFLQRINVSEDTLYADLSQQPKYPIQASGTINYKIDNIYFYQKIFLPRESLKLYLPLRRQGKKKINIIFIKTIYGNSVLGN